MADRQVTAEVLNPADANGFVRLLVRCCLMLNAYDNVPTAPKPVKIGEDVYHHDVISYKEGVGDGAGLGY